jgi:hypothetical protein
MILELLRGAIAMGLAVAGLFFLRFWKETRDRLFGLFAAAFFILALNRVLLSLLQEARETSLLPYCLRLLAFVIILAAIVDKNTRRT